MRTLGSRRRVVGARRLACKLDHVARRATRIEKIPNSEPSARKLDRIGSSIATDQRSAGTSGAGDCLVDLETMRTVRRRRTKGSRIDNLRTPALDRGTDDASARRQLLFEILIPYLESFKTIGDCFHSSPLRFADPTDLVSQFGKDACHIGPTGTGISDDAGRFQSFHQRGYRRFRHHVLGHGDCPSIWGGDLLDIPNRRRLLNGHVPRSLARSVFATGFGSVLHAE